MFVSVETQAPVYSAPNEKEKKGGGGERGNHQLIRRLPGFFRSSYWYE
jgi:hypothetical protein